MKKLLIYLLGTMLFAAMQSCEDVIDVKVEPGPAKLVVDAFVNNLPEPQIIRLTNSIPYFNKPGSEQGVEGATVLMIDTAVAGAPKLFLFADSGKGKYVWKPNPLSGDTLTVGKNYALVIIEGGDTMISFSRLNPTAKVDSLLIITETGDNPGIKAGKYVELAANDLPGEGNLYWIKTWYNDTFRNGIFEMNLAYDMAGSPNGQDGGLFIWPIRYGAINDFQKPYRPGDKVRVEIHSLTQEAFYWLTLIRNENQNGGLFAVPPSNIGTNVFNFNPAKKRGLAGFFCVSVVSRRTIVIP
jgi:Domain of unknown function (DUF4249)